MNTFNSVVSLLSGKLEVYKALQAPTYFFSFQMRKHLLNPCGRSLTQLMKANEEVSTSKTDLKKSQDRLKHAQGEIRKKQAELKKTESAYNKDKVRWE